MTRDRDIGNLILLAQMNYQRAGWLTLTGAWIFGKHHVIRHLGRVGRVSFWRGQPYLLSFRETATN